MLAETTVVEAGTITVTIVATANRVLLVVVETGVGSSLVRTLGAWGAGTTWTPNVEVIGEVRLVKVARVAAGVRAKFKAQELLGGTESARKEIVSRVLMTVADAGAGWMRVPPG